MPLIRWQKMMSYQQCGAIMASLYSLGGGTNYSAALSPRPNGVTRYYNRKKLDQYDIRGIDYLHTDTQIARYHSPYMRNARLLGENEPRHRAPLLSRLGAKRLNNFIDVDVPALGFPGYSDYDYVYYNRTIGDTISFTNKLSGVRFIAYNPDNCGGYLRISAHKIVGGLPGDEITSTTILSSKLQVNNWGVVDAYFPTCVQDTTEAIIMFRLVDDISTDECGDAVVKEDCYIHIGLAGEGAHIKGDIFQELKQCKPDKPTEYSATPRNILMKPITTDSGETIGQREYCCDGKDYLVWAIRTSTDVKLYRTEEATGTTTLIYSGIPKDVKRVRMAQAGADLYFVDGKSVLRKYNCNDGASDVVSPAGQEPPIASLILFHENRLFLNDVNSPNKVVFSTIDSVGPQYHIYESTAFVQVPDLTPKQSSCNPVVALESWRGEPLIFTAETSPYIFVSPSGFDIPTGVSLRATEGNVGAMSQEGVSSGRNGVFFYNREGLFLFTGAVSDKVSSIMDPEFARINSAKSEEVFVQCHDDKVRVYYARGTSTINDHMMMYYVALREWVNDDSAWVNGCVRRKRINKLFEFHSCLPIVSEAEAALDNLGAEINFVYYSPYFWFDSPVQIQKIHRIFASFIAVQGYTVDIGWDHQFRNKPVYVRRFIGPSLNDPEIDENDGDEDDTFSGEIYRKVKIKPSGRGCNSQIRIKSSLVGKQLELIGYRLEHDSADTK